VIARNSSFTYKGRAVDVKQVSRELGVRYVLEGSVRGTYHVLVDPKEWRSGFISRANVADFLVKQINDDTLLGKTPVLIG